MISPQDIETVIVGGGVMYSTNGEEVGAVRQVYLDGESGEPSLVRVSTGHSAASESLVPLLEATLEGNDLHVPYSKDQIKDAPHLGSEGGVSAAEQARLYSYYNPGSTGGGAGQLLASPDRPVTVTRSEEQLRVHPQIHETDKVWLRKYIGTEEVTLTVSVSHEEFRVEHEPINDATHDGGGAVLSEEDYEIVLYAERPVVHLETVPVERVRVRKQIITEERTITEQLRQERIDTDVTDPGSR
ncbi:YsnF/AvaK domain-containing protein [Paeniglutamicibacter antarcticus]|uniref:YsnF/AvaK domain-containing protein n=1 Tax=Arthrobacter terrae TaxID=2935737 RepID=A0A931G918_9MICC|nr:YsnF/AvaK domain-containing protein [Arthrobacter terrae]MBG0738267.1 YsnF/AvaK domain-containing protein [Arthrobacter terrae]